MNSNISEEELETFLREAGIGVSVPNPPLQQETSIEKLLDELLESAQITSKPTAAASADKIPPFLLKEEKPKRSRFSLLPLCMSIAFLGGILMGTIFGFYWGKIHRPDPFAVCFEEINVKLSTLVKEIQEIYEKINPTPVAEETIEIVDTPSDLEQLAPEAIL